MSLRFPQARCRARCGRLLRRAGAALVVAALVATPVSLLWGAQEAWAQDGSSPLVDVVEVDGVLDRTTADYVRDTIAKANRDGADLVVLRLDTPGGLGDAADVVVSAITSSQVPVLAYVGDAGARAYGAGAVIALSEHVLAVSPVAQVGFAAPADLRLAAADPADARQLGDRLADVAARRGRDEGFARAAAVGRQVLAVLPPGAAVGADVPAGAVPEGADLRTVGAEEAVDAGLVDLVEPTLSAALDAVRGTDVRLENGSIHTVAADDLNARVRFNSPGLVRQMLSTVSDPTVAYLLVVAAVLTVAFEIFQPGFGVAGFSGLLMGGMGLYGLAVLPVSWLAFALLVAGITLLALDLAIAGLGPLTAAGTAAFAAGSWWLFDGPPVLAVSGWLVAACTVLAVLFFVIIMTVVLRAQGSQAITGAESVVGHRAVVRSMLNPEGHVFVQGALWRARAPDSAGRVSNGTVVRVVGLDDRLTLEVEPVESVPAG